LAQRRCDYQSLIGDIKGAQVYYEDQQADEAAFHEAMANEASLTAEATKPDLATLRSDYDARRQHADDAAERYGVKFAELQAQIQQLEEQWAESNAELISEYHQIGADSRPPVVDSLRPDGAGARF